MNKIHYLNEMKTGDSGRILVLNAQETIYRRLLDLGFIPGTRVECLGCSPGGDPTAYAVRGTVIALRSEDCQNIMIDTDDKELKNGLN